MPTISTIAVLVICAVIVLVECDVNHSSGHVRIKRAKYYSNPPPRFYRRPPNVYPVKGFFSYTPPPNYMDNDDPPYPGNFRTKVSRRPPTPSSEGLGDEDINNLVKHLSKKDLDKIIEFTGGKYKENSFDKQNSIYSKEISDINFNKAAVKEVNAEKTYSQNGPFASGEVFKNIDSVNNQFVETVNTNNYHNFEPLASSFRGPYSQNHNDIKPEYTQDAPSSIYTNSQNLNHQDLSGIPLNTEESILNNEFSFMNSYIHQELYSAPSDKIETGTLTDGRAMEEEQLPKPINLRDDQDFDVSNTDNVPSVMKVPGYQVESFGDLPLMDYNSKLHTVSSYHVPHYSVISPSAHHPTLPQSPSASSKLLPSAAAAAIKAPQVEPAPPPSAAKEQSDSHLKAIKIWSHRSKGTAYTLHDDGTLSLEKPSRPKPVYGHS